MAADTREPTSGATNGVHTNGNGNGTAAVLAPSAPKFSISLGGSGTKNSASTAKPRPETSALKRPRAMLEEDAQDALHTSHPATASVGEQISTFGADDAAAEARRQAQRERDRVIQSLPNRDWREESRRKKRQKSGIPGAQGQGQEQGEKGMAGRDVVDGSSGVAYGLTTVADRAPVGRGAETEVVGSEMTAVAAPAAAEEGAGVPKTADEEALDALLGGKAVPTTTILPPSPPPTEDDAFRTSFASAPRMATLEEYAVTPVEGYGAAILRGYLKQGETLEGRSGKDKNGKGKERAAPVRRPGLLGLGAKDGGTTGVELGAWGRGAGRGKGRREEVVYNPVAMRNRKTGEVVSEEEMRKRIEEQEAEDREGRRRVVRDGEERKEREGGRERKMLEYDVGDRKRERHGHGDNEEDGRRHHRDRDREHDESDRRRRRDDDGHRRKDDRRHDYGDEDDASRRHRRREQERGRRDREADGHRSGRR